MPTVTELESASLLRSVSLQTSAADALQTTGLNPSLFIVLRQRRMLRGNVCVCRRSSGTDVSRHHWRRRRRRACAWRVELWPGSSVAPSSRSNRCAITWQRRLTTPLRGQTKARCARIGQPLMSNVRQRKTEMASLDHLILKVNDLDTSVAFYTQVLGFTLEGTDGPFTLVRAGPNFQLQLAPWGTPGLEHYAFAVSHAEFEEIFGRIKAMGIAYGPTFSSVGANTGPGRESGAQGAALTIYFNDPNLHLLEIRSYEA